MSSSSHTSSSQLGSPGPSQPPLPQLTAEAAIVLRKAQEDVVRMLAEKKIDLSLYPEESNGVGKEMKENEQNVKNRGWEVTYEAQIQRAQEEDEAWKEVHYFYEAHKKTMLADIQGRRARKVSQAESSKAKGKRRATGRGDGDAGTGSDGDSNPREHELGEDFRGGVALARAVLGLRSVAKERVVRPAAVTMKTGQKVTEVLRRLEDIEFKLDQLYTRANTVRKMSNIPENDLDRRFALLSANLAARSDPPTMDLALPSGHTLSTYVPREGSGGTDPQELLKALARIDSERPPAMRSVREVQRVEEWDWGCWGEEADGGYHLQGLDRRRGRCQVHRAVLTIRKRQ